MADQGNIHIGKIYMCPQIFVDPGSNNAGDFSFEEIGCSPYESYKYKQGKPQNFEDFGFHSFSGIGFKNVAKIFAYSNAHLIIQKGCQNG
jgi:hypothetical protein